MSKVRTLKMCIDFMISDEFVFLEAMVHTTNSHTIRDNEYGQLIVVSHTSAFHLAHDSRGPINVLLSEGTPSCV